MSAIAGILGIGAEKTDLKAMQTTLLRRGPSLLERCAEGEAVLLHSLKDGTQKGTCCLEKVIGGETYMLVWSGNLYNKKDLQAEFLRSQENASLGDIVLSAYAALGRDCLKRMNGVFTFAVYEKNSRRLFLARDPMGIKPLFYGIRDNKFIFGSELKTILAFPGFPAVLDRQGARELVLLGPGRMPGSGIFHGIRELGPGSWLEFRAGRLQTGKYWDLKDGPHLDSFPETVEKIRLLLEDAVKLQTGDLEEFGAMLSGGLDSSILCALCKRQSPDQKLKTFSVDYLHNRQYFVPGKFQPDSDDTYISIMTDSLSSDHRKTILTPEDLAEGLEEALISRDLPGMGDVDSSLLAFCREVKKYTPAVLSGECADEIFGGYPWFRDPEIRNQEGFPWAQNAALRAELLRDPGDHPQEFILEACLDTCRNADILPECRGEDRRIKELVNLNMKWFMQTLVDRNDRMSASAGLQIRVPFCDIRIAEYLYRIPWEMKDYGGREKGLLRQAVRDLLPEAVRMRKKSPYPKTFDPRYEAIVTKKVRDLLLEDRPIWYLISRKTVIKVLTEGLSQPFYGQLMRKPQFCAWILQLDLWLEHYRVSFSF